MERLPCEPSPECKYWEAGCKEDIHHLIYPRREYRFGIARQYREHPTHKQLVCRAIHDEIHATFNPPEKITQELMAQFLINNQCTTENG